MDLYFLGTGAGLPSKNRNVSAIALSFVPENGGIWLFDCGEGTQQQILHAPIKIHRIDKIFITHLHGDHIYGLPGLLGTRGFQGATHPISIYGPPGIAKFIEVSLSVSRTHLPYKLVIHEVSAGRIYQDDQYQVETASLEHGISSWGYRITETDRPGRLDVAELQALGVQSGPIYGRLKRGETVQLDDGRIIDGARFRSAAQPGRIITILGDTRKCDAAIRLAQNADVLVHEATFDPARLALAQAYYHSTSEEAAQVAREAQVHALILTHVSSRYDDGAAQSLLTDAKQIFPNSFIAHDHYRHAVTRKAESTL
jgi:ribonuclease Z